MRMLSQSSLATVQIFRPHAGQPGDFMGVPGYPQPSGQRATELESIIVTLHNVQYVCFTVVPVYYCHSNSHDIDEKDLAAYRCMLNLHASTMPW